MDTRRIGSLEVPLVGLGCNNFGGRLDEGATAAVIDAALDAGVTFFDTADTYGGAGRSEELIGAVLGARRDQVVLATKFGSPMSDTEGGAAPAYVREAAEDSLRRLRTDRIDLYQLHRPDPDTPIADTLGALDELVREGKVLEIGCSNFSAAQLEEAEAASSAGGLARFVSVQNHYNLLHREPEAEVLPSAEALGLAFLPFFPLANGLLTGKYQPGEPPPPGTRISTMPDARREQVLGGADWKVIQGLTEFATDRGHSLLELAIAWLAAQPTIASVIAGATKPEQVRANAVAAGWTLGTDDLNEVRGILEG